MQLNIWNQVKIAIGVTIGILALITLVVISL
jgi:hypothetical protein